MMFGFFCLGPAPDDSVRPARLLGGRPAAAAAHGASVGQPLRNDEPRHASEPAWRQARRRTAHSRAARAYEGIPRSSVTLSSVTTPLESEAFRYFSARVVITITWTFSAGTRHRARKRQKGASGRREMTTSPSSLTALWRYISLYLSCLLTNDTFLKIIRCYFWRACTVGPTYSTMYSRITILYVAYKSSQRRCSCEANHSTDGRRPKLRDGSMRWCFCPDVKY